MESGRQKGVEKRKRRGGGVEGEREGGVSLAQLKHEPLTEP